MLAFGDEAFLRDFAQSANRKTIAAKHEDMTNNLRRNAMIAFDMNLMIAKKPEGIKLPHNRSRKSFLCRKK
jgi:hypothetical protein